MNSERSRAATMRACVCAAILGASLLGCVSSARADVSGPEIVGFVNSLRAANGIPAGIVEDPALSDGCAQHDHYMAVNGVVTHYEDPSLPGYTPEGDQAARTSVLYDGGPSWSATSDPFAAAPLHLHSLLAPRIDRMGAAEVNYLGCATTASLNRTPPAADATYTYPGDGAVDSPIGEDAEEAPYTPGQEVGISQGTVTGPYLLVMFDGPDVTPSDVAKVTSASLSGPDGPVDIATVDNYTSGLAGLMPTGAEIIPRAPLAYLTTYTANITADVTTQGRGGPSRRFSHSWSFTTLPVPARPNTVYIASLTTLGQTVKLTVSSDAPGATVEAIGPGPTVSQAVDGSGNATLKLPAPGTWEVCARSGGGQSGYAAGQDCAPVHVDGTDSTTSPGTPGTRSVPWAHRFTMSVPTHLSHRTKRIKVVIAGPAPFTERASLSRVHGGRTLVRYRAHRVRSGRKSTLRLTVPRRDRRAGHAVRLVLTLRSGAHHLTMRRTIRYR